MAPKIHVCPVCGGELQRVSLDRYKCHNSKCGKTWLIHELREEAKR